MKFLKVFSQILILASAVNAQATFMPPNNLNLQDNLNKRANITEQMFNQIIDQVSKEYVDVIAAYGATLSVDRRWTDSTVNAMAQQIGKKWMVTMYGGLARRPEMTPDGFALVMCHELGHHLAGFSFKGSSWAANEGQADYFATEACARRLWAKDTIGNEQAQENVDAFARNECNKIWSAKVDQNLCYRISSASMALATLLAGGTSQPQFDKPDSSVAVVTNNAHPKAQCRLDTYFAGSLCNAKFDFTLIPGKDNPQGQQSKDAELIANKYSCSKKDGATIGVRPACWFKSNFSAKRK